MEWMEYGLIDSLSGSSSRVGAEDILFHRKLGIGKRARALDCCSEWADGWTDTFWLDYSSSGMRRDSFISVGLIPCLFFFRI